MENILIIFIHLMAAAVGTGSLVYSLLVLLPAVEKLPQQKVPEEQSVLYKTLEVLAPTVFVSLLVLVGSGIYYLMVNYTRQVDLTAGYYNIFGVKMVFVVAAIFLSIYQTFTLRGKISDLDLRPENRELVPATLDKMRTLSKLTLTAITATVLLGVWLARF